VLRDVERVHQERDQDDAAPDAHESAQGAGDGPE
jgi:hypothetical protein